MDSLGSIKVEKVERAKNLLAARPAGLPRILLIDDDGLFCLKMARIAKRYEFPIERLDTIKNPDEINYWNYDVVIMDYDLGETDGIEVAKNLQEMIGDVQIILVSNSEQNRIGEPWPTSVKEFIAKELGSDAIFERALNLYAETTPV